MNRRSFIIGTGGAVTAGSIGSLAFTQASVERDLDVQVVSDSSADAALRFQASEGTTVTEDGQIVVNGVADGNNSTDKYLTPDGEFTFGDDSAPATTPAFSMTNQLSESRSFDVSVSGLDAANTDISIAFYDDTGSELGTADKSSDATGISVSSGQIVYAVVTITTGSDDSDLTGTVTISASDQSA